MNSSTPMWQAALNPDAGDFDTPIRSAFFYVFQMYVETARARYVPVEHLGMPTVTNEPYGSVLFAFTTMRVEIINGATYDAENTATTADAVTLLDAGSLAPVASFPTTIPAHSLVRFTLE